ncbi:MAG: hypothetical protein ACOCRO_03210 [Halanaerobiales bacterium]
MKEQEESLGKVLFRQEIMVEFLGSANTVIDADKLKELMKKGKEPEHVDLQGRLRIYEKPLSGATYVCGCLPVGEKVLTSNGMKNVEHVLPDDKLYDINGNETDIENIQIYKNYKGDIYEISIYGSLRKTRFTEEHPIYASISPKMKRKRNHPIYGNSRYRDFNFDYHKVKNLSIDDWVCFPNIYKNNIISDKELKNKIKEYSIESRIDFRIDNNIILDKNF